MKKYIYTLVALLLLGSCAKKDVNYTNETNNSAVTVLDNGDLQVALNLSISDMDEREVITRSELVGDEANIEDGWAFVFSEDENGEEVDGIKYGDNSKLLQKVEYKYGSSGQIFVTLQPYDEPCFLRLMANVTDMTEAAINKLVADDDVASSTSSTYEDYKYVSVSLIGYYNISYDDLFGDGSVLPDPSNLRVKKSGYPAASPGVAMPEGISSESLEELDKSITLVPVGSKVTVESTCDFELEEVYALNVAKRTMMRSTVVADDGLSEVMDYPIPTNFGGTTKTMSVAATDNTTEALPIYIFPNEGDEPYADDDEFAGEEDILGYLIENESLYPCSDIPNDKNPTYIIVKGRAKGYSVDGYYKIALINSDNNYTYDILRSGHYKVNIYDVDNAGYATAKEAEEGPSSEVSYDVTIGVSKDSRNIVKVSNNGLFSVELDANEIYAQGYGTAGVDADFMVKLVDNDIEDDYFTTSSTATLSATEGITLNKTSISADGVENSVSFNATKSGTITLRCGDLIQEVKVYYNDLGYSRIGGDLTTDDGSMLYTSSSAIEDFGGDSYTSGLTMLSSTGSVASNIGNFENRECRAKIYRGGVGITKVYLRQASDFNLYDNVTGDEASENQNIIYQSTGNIYTYNGIDVESEDGNDNRDYVVQGEVTQSGTEGWTASGSSYNFGYTTTVNGFSLSPLNIGDNRGSTYGASDVGTSLLKGSKSVTLTNIAGETKTYSLAVSQYALPVIEDKGDTYGKYSGGVYYWIDPKLTADLYDTDGNIFTDYYNRGESVGDITIYNCNYNNGDYPVGDWAWEAMTSSSIGYSSSYTVGGEPLDERTGSSSAIAWCKYGANVGATTSGNNVWKFTVNIFDRTSSHSGKYSSYFCITVTNDANEEVVLKIMIRYDRSFLSN